MKLRREKTVKRMGSVRLVGGRWRSRRLPVLERPGLRPTGDRQRETLFNWLQGAVVEVDCLDLFAGSGALGLEALSRGAKSLQAVELDKGAAEQLKRNVELLEANAQVVQGDWSDFLATTPQHFGLVFLDPPFAQQLLPEILPQLDRCLAQEAWVYAEDEASRSLAWPEHWHLHREKTSGSVVTRLFHVIRS